jgi:hypothetical protein
MIEQTALIVSKWQYNPPVTSIDEAAEKLTSSVSFDVMKKRTAGKKGIACRFTVKFFFHNEMILEYTGENSYVIDLQDVIDMNELHTMIRNSYSLFNEKFELRKLTTVLSSKSLLAIDVAAYDLEPVLQLLK